MHVYSTNPLQTGPTVTVWYDSSRNALKATGTPGGDTLTVDQATVLVEALQTLRSEKPLAETPAPHPNEAAADSQPPVRCWYSTAIDHIRILAPSNGGVLGASALESLITSLKACLRDATVQQHSQEASNVDA